jgi:hypothetical protein
MGEIRNPYRILMEEQKGKIPFGIYRFRWNDGIK